MGNEIENSKLTAFSDSKPLSPSKEALRDTWNLCSPCSNLNEPADATKLKKVAVLDSEKDSENKENWSGDSENKESGDIARCSCGDTKEMESYRSHIIDLPEEVQGFAVTPSGVNTSYKGVPTSELLTSSKAKQDDPPKKRTKTGSSKGKEKVGRPHSGAKAATVVDAVCDRSSFTKKLQQFLSGSKTLFSPQSKTHKESVAGTRSENEIENIAMAKTSLANKSLTFQKEISFQDSDTVEETDPAAFVEVEKRGGNQEVPVLSEPADDAPSYSAVVSTDSIRDSGTVKEDTSEQASKQRSKFNSLRCAIREGIASSPKSAKHAGSCSKVAQTKGVRSRENVQRKGRLYSRECLIKLSRAPACGSKPEVTECVDVSVLEEIELGTEVSPRYLPLRILSRDFKLKYRL